MQLISDNIRIHISKIVMRNEMRTFIIILLSLLIAIPARAQESPLTRKVLYTLNYDEVLFSNNDNDTNPICTILDDEKYDFVIENKNTGTYSLIFNGKRIASTNYRRDDRLPFSVDYSDHEVEDGYLFTYCKRTDIPDKFEYYVNIGGIENGPYESAIIFLKRRSLYAKPFSYSDVRYFYKLDGEWFCNDSGDIKNLYFGGNIVYFARSDTDKLFGIVYVGGLDKYYLNTGDRTFGPFSFLYDFRFGRITDTGKFAFSYTEDPAAMKWNVNINGQKYGTYSSVKYPQITDSGKFAFCHQNGTRWFANINGGKIGPYSAINNLHIADNGKFAFNYYDHKNREYVNLNGEIYGPYSYIDNLHITDSGKFAFSYKENDESYVNIDNEIYGPYQKFREMRLFNSGEFIIHYADSIENLLNYNGNIYTYRPNNPDLQSVWQLLRDNNYRLQPISDGYIITDGVSQSRINHKPDSDNKINITSRDKRYRFLSNSESGEVTINDEIIDASPPFIAWYDPNRRAFLWASTEDKELVLYEYKLK